MGGKNMSRRININCPEIEEKILFLWNGKVLIKADVSDSDYKKFLKIKEKYFSGREYDALHSNLLSSRNWKNRCYYIPDDIFDYIMIKNGKIIEKRQVPNKLKEKFENCKRIMEIDLNFLKNYRFIGGEALGIRSSWRIWKPAIRIVRSENKISCSDYEMIISGKYMRNYEKNLEEQEYYLKHGYRE